MASLFASVAALAAFGTLALAGLLHLRHFRRFRQTLALQELLSRRIQPLIALAVVGAELTIGSAGLLGLFQDESAPLVMFALTGAAIMFLLFTLYLLALLRKGSRAPCGCDGADRPVTPLAAWRSLLLLLLAVLAAVAQSAIMNLGSSSFRVLVAYLAAVALTTLIWIMPESLGPSALESTPSVGQRTAEEGMD